MPNPPPLWPTILVTALFGLFGLIPASVAASRAGERGVRPGRYWRAFGITFGVVLLVQAVLLVAVIGPLLRLAMTGYGWRPAISDDPDAPAVTGAPPVAQPTLPPTTAPRTTAPPTPASPTVASLPVGSWITVLDSLPKSLRSEQEAWTVANGLTGAAPVVVVDSDEIPGLNPGYWAISITGSSSRNEATGWCAVVNRPVGGTCYPRQVG